jgi:hypothetical protein
MTKGSINNINDHIVSALERLNNKALQFEEQELEVRKGHAVASLAKEALKIASIRMEALRLGKELERDDTIEFVTGEKQPIDVTPPKPRLVPAVQDSLPFDPAPEPEGKEDEEDEYEKGEAGAGA